MWWDKMLLNWKFILNTSYYLQVLYEQLSEIMQGLQLLGDGVLETLEVLARLLASVVGGSKRREEADERSVRHSTRRAANGRAGA